MPKFRDIAEQVAEDAGVSVQAARVATQVAINRYPAPDGFTVDKMRIPSKMAAKLKADALELIEANEIPDYLALIAEHTKAMEDAELAMAAAKARRDEAIADAHQAGHAVKDIQDAAGGLSRAMIHHIAKA